MTTSSKPTPLSGTEPLVFFGSGDVAAKSLELLAQHQMIEAVVTKPQPAHHKARFPVLAVAEKLGLTVLETADKATLTKLFETKPVTSRLGVVIDYGIIMPKNVIDSFELGIINSHFSLLPRWRGADPISFAILNGDHLTGVSLMLIVEQLDEGDLLAQRPLDIIDESTPELTEKLIKLSDELLRETLPKYLSGELKPYPQATDNATYSRKLTKADSQLDWQKPAETLAREVRAFAGWPRSRCTIGTQQVVVTAARPALGDGVPGTVRLADKQLAMYCGQGVLVIDRLIPAGKKEMSGADFLLGYKP
jgi:methionyl-tRNA formyltransferase